MELVLFFVPLLGIGALCCLVFCFFYFVYTDRPVSLALKLSWKMSLGSTIGLLLLGIGAILLPAIWFNAVVEPLPNYSRWRDIIAAFLIATVTCVIMYFTLFALAWEVFG